MRILSAVLLFAFLFTSACSFAPMNTPTSGRSLGKGKTQIQGSVLPTLGGMVSHGFTDDLDAGAILELQFGMVASLYAKYAITNSPEGFAFSVFGGAFYGQGFGDSYGFYAGPIVSYRRDKLEGYLSVRYNRVHWKIADLTQSEVDDSVFTITATGDTFSFGYLQTDLGVNMWFSKTAALNLHAKLWTFLSDDLDSDTSVLPGVALLFEFD